MDEQEISSENVTTVSKQAIAEKANFSAAEDGKKSPSVDTEVLKSEAPVEKIEEVESELEKEGNALELNGLEAVSDTKSEHDLEEDFEDEYYESISEDEAAAAAEVDDISSAEDDNFVDTVPKHSFTDLPFVPKAEFSSELLNTVKEEKFDSEENNFNRKPFSSSVPAPSNNNDPSKFVHYADFSVPPPNFSYNANENVNFPQGYNYNYDQSGYYSAQQNYAQNPWYGNQSGQDQASFGNQQYYGQVGYYNYNQAAYQNYDPASYSAQQSYSESNVGVPPSLVQPHVPPQGRSDHLQGAQNHSAQVNATQYVSSSVVENQNVNSGSVVKSDSGVLSTVTGDSIFKKDALPDSVVREQDQNQDATEVPVNRQISYKPRSSVKQTSPAADWLDENGDPVKGAFDFEAPEDTDYSSENKSSRVEYMFSVRNLKSAKDPSIATVADGDTIGTAKTVDKKQSVIPNTGLSISEQIAAERAKVSEKEIPADEEKELYEASKNGEEYKAALQAALATTSLAKVTPSTSKLLAENAAVQKETVSRFKRMQFTNQTQRHEVEEPPSLSVGGTSVQPKKTETDVALESQAITEILKEVQHGAARAKQYGALGWQKNPVPVVNKRFLHNTLVSTLREPYRPPSKRGGRTNQGLNDKGDGSRTGSSSGSSRSYSSDSRSSSRSSRSSYSSDSDRSRSHDRHGPPGLYEEAWAAYAAHYGYPWMGPEAYGMYYGPDGWPMDEYNAMFYGDPQAWADYDGFYGPQDFNPRGRGRGFRGRGRDRGRGMDIRGRGEFRGRGWNPEFRGGGGRGMEFRGGPPRGFPFPPHFRGMGPRYPRRRSFSRSRSRSRGSESDPELRGGSKYGGASRNPSRAGSRKSRSRSRSPYNLSNRGRSESGPKDSPIEKSEKDSNDKSKKKKKKKHRKTKKRKDKDKNEGSDGQSKEDDPNEKPAKQTDSKDKQNKDEEEKSKSKKSKKRSKHKKKEGKEKKDKAKGDKPNETAGDNPDVDKSSRKGHEEDGKDAEKGKELKDKSQVNLFMKETEQAEEKRSSSKKSKSSSRDQSRAGSEEKHRKTKRREKESGSSRDRRAEINESRDKDYHKSRDKSSRREKDGQDSRKDGENPSERRNESYQGKEAISDRNREGTRGEALETDLRLKLKAKREQMLLQGSLKRAETERKETLNDKSDPHTKVKGDRDRGDPTVDNPSDSGKKKVLKKKKIVKKKKGASEDPARVSVGAGEENIEKEPKKKKIVKKKIIVRRKKVKSGELEKGTGAADGEIDGTVTGHTCDSSNVDQTVGNDGNGVKGVKRKRIVKRTIIVKRKKVKVSQGSGDVQTAGGETTVSVPEPHGDSQAKTDHSEQSGEGKAS